MANDFKLFTAENVGTSPVTIYTSPASKESIVLELDVANITGSDVTCNVEIVDNSASRTVMLVKTATVPTGSSLKAINGQKIVLEAQDAVKVTSSASTSLDVVCSVLEDV